MKSVYPRHALVMTRPSQLPGGRMLDVTLLAVSTLRTASLVRDIANWPDAAFIDEGSRKFRGEWLAIGSAFSPGGEQVRELVVRVRIGRAEKSLAVFGERMWKGNSPSRPAPLSEMPIDWKHAFGGEGFPDNPGGKGVAPIEGLHLLPNVEHPERLIIAPTDRPTAASFTPIAVDAPYRTKKLGSYDAAWQERDWPDFARDLDATYFNVASPDQWLDEGQFFRGDEEVRIDNMHPERPALEGRLPGLAARCFVNRRQDDRDRFDEVAMRLDTVVLVPNVERIVTVFRGATPIVEDDAFDVKHLLAALERIGERRTSEHYRAALEKRLDLRKAADARDDDLLPSGISETTRAAEEPTPELERLVKLDRLLAKNLRRGAELELEKTREQLLARGIDPDAHGVPKALPPPAHEVDDEDADRLLAGADAEIEDFRAQAEKQMRAEMDRARAVCAKHGVDLDAKIAENKKQEGGPPKFSPHDVLGQLEDAATLSRNAGVPDEQNQALGKLRDPALRADLAEMQRRLVAGYRDLAHHFPAALSLDGPRGAAARRQVEELLRSGASFAGRDLTGVDLSGLDLSGRDFRQALLESADLHGANLEGTDLTGAVLTRADLGSAKTAGIRLASANLGGATLAGLALMGADLRGAVLLKTDLSGADLTDANLDDADLGEARLDGANLERATARGAQFAKVRIVGARLTGADLTGATLHDLDLSEMNFDGAKLDKAELVDCAGRRASFRGASMINTRFCRIEQNPSFSDADFTNACLRHANLRDIELERAVFANADLTDADLSGASCEDANFHRARARRSSWVRANLRRAVMTDADLRESLMKNATLAGARLEGANLFRANLLFVHVDGTTDIHGAEVGQIVYRENPDR